jgi:hypothetical protein
VINETKASIDIKLDEHRSLVTMDLDKAAEANKLSTGDGKHDVYVSGSKTHPLFFDEMTPELISAMERPLLKTKAADYIAFLNLKDKQTSIKHLRNVGFVGAITSLATAGSMLID